MDLSCPSFVVFDQTSDYGSRNTCHNDEEKIGGLVWIRLPEGIHITVFGKKTDLACFQQRPSSSVGPDYLSTPIRLKVRTII